LTYFSETHYKEKYCILIFIGNFAFVDIHEFFKILIFLICEYSLCAHNAPAYEI